MQKRVLSLAVCTSAAFVWFFTSTNQGTNPPQGTTPLSERASSSLQSPSDSEELASTSAADSRGYSTSTAASETRPKIRLQATNKGQINWADHHVIPTTRHENDTSCDVLEIDGERVCWNQLDYNPYLAYSIEQLRQMASEDAMAADALVQRLPRRSDERMAYAIHATNLSGKPGPIYRYVMMTPIAGDDYQRQLEMYSLLRYADSMASPEPKAVWFEKLLLSKLELDQKGLQLEANMALEKLFDRAAAAREAS